ncbi:MAG: class I SAM-dependent methyltransferase [Planctomycetes bacterium]|nr:class I SAM-dependent methyltransferase [Planctomycetota bacterium]
MRFNLNHAILRAAGQVRFASVLDVGGAEGYLAHLLAEVYGAEATSCDLSAEACARGTQLFGLPTVAVSASRLPFDDASFDLVTCSEVLEHLEDPIGTLREIRRVARRAVIITTEEFASDGLAAYLERFRLADFDAHGERNIFTRRDLELGLGEGERRWCGQCKPHQYSEHLDLATARRALHEIAAAESGPRDGEEGIILVQGLDADVWRERPFDDEALWTKLFADVHPPLREPLDMQRGLHPALLPLFGDALREGAVRLHAGVPLAYRPADDAALDEQAERLELLRRTFLARPLPAPPEQIREAAFLERVLDALREGALPGALASPRDAARTLDDPAARAKLVAALWEREPFVTGRLEAPLAGSVVREGDAFGGWAVAHVPITSFVLRVDGREFDLGAPQPRPDVAARFPEQPHAGASGFSGAFLGVAGFAGRRRIAFVARLEGGASAVFAEVELELRG